MYDLRLLHKKPQDFWRTWCHSWSNSSLTSFLLKPLQFIGINRFFLAPSNKLHWRLPGKGAPLLQTTWGSWWRASSRRAGTMPWQPKEANSILRHIRTGPQAVDWGKSCPPFTWSLLDSILGYFVQCFILEKRWLQEDLAAACQHLWGRCWEGKVVQSRRMTDSEQRLKPEMFWSNVRKKLEQSSTCSGMGCPQKLCSLHF